MRNIIKLTITIVALIIITNTPLLAQLRFDYPIKSIEKAEAIAVYSLSYTLDSLDTEYMMQEDMLLFLGEETSLFLSQQIYTFDTLIRNIKNEAQFSKYLMSGNIPITPFGYKLIKNYPLGKMTTIDHIPSDSYKYEENLSLISWQILPDTSRIKGYQVQKAICNFSGREWMAWFASEIPYNDGPYKFNGLPGLILKVYDSKHHYNFDLISINRLTELTQIDYVEKTFIITTKQDFFKAKDEFRNDIVNRAAAAGMNSEHQQKIGRKMEKQNNPLELIRD